jgi:glycosyltransferase involved in cell wall biosynthesis
MHNTTDLIAGLSKARHAAKAEVIFVDDASPQAWPRETIKACADQSPLAVTLLESHDNLGRSGARNLLLQHARAHHVLFLDADMIPDRDDFLDEWIAVIEDRAPAVAFGGFTLQKAPRTRRNALHHFVSARSDCRPALQRRQDPAQFTTTSNLLVQRSVLHAIPFDEGFSGWGWEDVDWALRAAKQYEITHVDIPATHAGLDDADILLRKADRAGPNYRRLVDRHPDAVARFRSYQIAKRLTKVPMLEFAKRIFAQLMLFDRAPLPLRAAAYKLFRTLTYAQALK